MEERVNEKENTQMTKVFDTGFQTLPRNAAVGGDKTANDAWIH